MNQDTSAYWETFSVTYALMVTTHSQHQALVSDVQLVRAASIVHITQTLLTVIKDITAVLANLHALLALPVMLSFSLYL